ncbi:piggyBac transposable element-derived protein 4 [Trichonephila clavipes]|uniref:PiggyBac transposable element-derived protein 4 n=1 Tax=Trichonephila clavipes TaxID=2585209 RepID=A0A8X6WAD6_TRICX|nr:piggyBac transposable element-derived protein 4 [Trichonephila clavipes]
MHKQQKDCIAKGTYKEMHRTNGCFLVCISEFDMDKATVSNKFSFMHGTKYVGYRSKGSEYPVGSSSYSLSHYAPFRGLWKDYFPPTKSYKIRLWEAQFHYNILMLLLERFILWQMNKKNRNLDQLTFRVALACQLIDGYSSRKRKRRPASFQVKKCAVPDDVRLASVVNHVPKMVSN